MPELAGFSGLHVTPASGWRNQGEFTDIDNQEWKSTILEVQKVFSGKLGGECILLVEADLQIIVNLLK